MGNPTYRYKWIDKAQIFIITGGATPPLLSMGIRGSESKWNENVVVGGWVTRGGVVYISSKTKCLFFLFLVYKHLQSVVTEVPCTIWKMISKDNMENNSQRLFQKRRKMSPKEDEGVMGLMSRWKIFWLRAKFKAAYHRNGNHPRVKPRLCTKGHSALPLMAHIDIDTPAGRPPRAKNTRA